MWKHKYLPFDFGKKKYKVYFIYREKLSCLYFDRGDETRRKRRINKKRRKERKKERENTTKPNYRHTLSACLCILLPLS